MPARVATVMTTTTPPSSSSSSARGPYIYRQLYD